MQELAASFVASLQAPPDSVPQGQGTIWLRWSDSLRGRCDVVEIAGSRDVITRATLHNVDMFLVTRDAGILSLEIELPSGIGLGTVYAALNALRHLHRESKSGGLSFPRAPTKEVIDPEYVRAWGGVVGRAIGDLAGSFGLEAPTPMPLGAFVNWLLLMPTEDPDRVTIERPATTADDNAILSPECAKVGRTRFAKHHTVIVLASPPRPEEARTWLFRLSNGFSDDYLPPKEASWTVEILEPRGNRLIGVSRTGACSVSWVPIGANAMFERKQWPSRFLGIYRLLAIHVLNQHQSLLKQASALAALGPDIAELTAASPASSLRERLDRIVRTTVGQMITLTTAGDCSASLPNYAEFYAAERRAHGLDLLISGIREDLHDVVEVVNSLHEREERQQERRLSTTVGLLALVLVPFSIAQGMAALFPGLFPGSPFEFRRPWGWVWLVGLCGITTAISTWLRRRRARRDR